MKIVFRLTPDDYWEASRVYGRRAEVVRRSAVFIAVAIICIWLTHASGIRGLYASALLVAAILVLEFAGAWIAGAYFKRSLRKASEGDGEYSKECAVDISEAGVQIPGTADLEQWSTFSAYAESPRLFVLFQNKSIVAIFPKRALCTKDITDLRQIFRSKLPQL